jgi:hypothetical protein
VDPRINDLADSANRLNALVAESASPRHGSQVATDNAALSLVYGGPERMMSAYVRYYAAHASSAAETMHLLLTHPVTVQQGFRTPSGSLAAPERSIIEAAAHVRWVCGPDSQVDRVTRLARRLAQDAYGVKGTMNADAIAGDLATTIHRYLNPGHIGTEELRSRLAKPAPSRGELVKEALGPELKRAWSAISASLHYSPTWDTLLGQDDAAPRAEYHRLNASYALQALARLEATMRRTLVSRDSLLA